MKKNFIEAFQGKVIKMENVTGGYKYDETSRDGGRTWGDEQKITEKGELTPEGVTTSYQCMDSEVYDR